MPRKAAVSHEELLPVLLSTENIESKEGNDLTASDFGSDNDGPLVKQKKPFKARVPQRNDCVTTLQMGIDSYGPHVGSTQAAMSLQFFKEPYFDRYIKIEACCNDCGAEATGTVFNEPLQGEAVSLQWRCEDTINIPLKKKIWLTGAPIPNVVSIYDSKALKSALSRCFGQSNNINDYVQKCFDAVCGTTSKLPTCYIRLDLAHFLKAAIDWNVERIIHTLLRIIDCDYNFKRIQNCSVPYTHLISPRRRSVILWGNLTEEYFEYIKNKIKGTKKLYQCLQDIMAGSKDKVKCPINDSIKLDDDSKELNDDSKISQWVLSILDDVQQTIQKEVAKLTHIFYQILLSR
ncbi:hypothetical protein J6590_096009 [Homalodisca vitripennis]|nr:hypothetical protein J6590_096009 [Homalodisca vitripennis]